MSKGTKAAEKGPKRQKKEEAEDDLGSQDLDEISSFNSNDEDDDSGNDEAAATNQQLFKIERKI